MKHVQLIATAGLVISLLGAAALRAAEIGQLHEENWDRLVPDGKEVDAIYGDIALRSDRLSVVIAQPIDGRHANLTVKDVGGAVLDLTSTRDNNDQLSAFYPGGGGYDLRVLSLRLAADIEALNVAPADGAQALSGGAPQIELVLGTARVAGRPQLTVTYHVADGQPGVTVVTEYRNPHEKPLEVEILDRVRADRSFETGYDAQSKLAWWYDKWFGQAYGVLCTDHVIQTRAGGPRGGTEVRYQIDGKNVVALEPGKSFTITRVLLPARDLVELKSLAGQALGGTVASAAVTVTDRRGPVVAADVVVRKGDAAYAWGRTDQAGKLALPLPPGSYELAVSAIGRPDVARRVEIAGEGEAQVAVTMQPPGYVVAKITDENGGPIPCKVQFIGRDKTVSPDWFPDSGEHAVKNLYYTHTGTFRQEIGPGQYDVIISRGPEYDAVFTQITIERDAESPLTAKLVRTVDTKGWVSTDYHSHSSPSGDNTSSQLGRVLNLICEHVEYAPCTEHNRIDTYVPHLKRLGVEHLMGTSTGIELTGSVLPVNHHNAFPLVHKPRTQDGGGPRVDVNPLVQIERLALWDGGSEKLIQQNHPDIVRILGDRDDDGKPDEGFEKMFGFMDVIEVHPPQEIFTPPQSNDEARRSRRTIFHWLQMLNLGYRVPGVVNTDAHYNHHGSGFLRNWVKSPTDDPAKIDTMDIVRASQRGNSIMGNGPFMEVTLKAAQGEGPSSQVGPGDDLVAPGGKAELHVRIQCPNWLDIDRVQVLVNGRLVPELNYTRREHPQKFSSQTVRFDQRIALELGEDAHVIVAAIGENLQLGPVMGPEYGKHKPVAVSNPIFVDIDGQGFRPNGDLLGIEVPHQGKSDKVRPSRAKR